MQRSSFPPVASRGSIQDLVSNATSDISDKVRHIIGPTRAERHAVLGGGSSHTRREALMNSWADQVIGKKVIVMAGAGISVASGIPDFRDKEHGVYARIRRQYGTLTPEDIFRSEVYESNPEPLCLWLQEFLAIREEAVPTVTHLFLKLLEEKGCLLRVYTQNIDGLELAAGLPPDRVVMAHGDMSRPECALCGRPHAVAEFERKVRAGQVPICEQMSCGGPVRPDIVFFSEATRIPHGFQKDFDACDLLLVMGTSLSVNPFGNLATRVPILCPRMLINPDKVLIKDCRHRSRQLNFDSPKAYRDVWLGGHCDEASRHLAMQLGWHADLLRLEREFHPVDPLGARNVPAAMHAGSGYDKDSMSATPTSASVSPRSKSPTPSAYGASESTGVLSDLGEWDLADECCSESALPHFAQQGPNMPRAFSGRSLASLISEISEDNFEGDMNLVDCDTGNIMSL